MKKLLLIFSLLLLSIIACKISLDPIKEDCNCNSENNRINFIFKYGIAGKNVINTFDCTYTKDMVLDPSITICLKLSIDEIDSIFVKMNQIDFFNYPNVFHVKLTSDTVGSVTPFSSYYFYVESNEVKKELFWEDSIVNQDQDADKLRELIRLIINTIETKMEYKNLPPARGGYG